MWRNLFFTSDLPRSAFTFLRLYTRRNPRNSGWNSRKDFYFHQFKGALSIKCFLFGMFFLPKFYIFNDVLDLQVSKISFTKNAK